MALTIPRVLSTILLLFMVAPLTPAKEVSPREFSKRAASKILSERTRFFGWHYGGAIILDALWSFKEAFGLDYQDTISELLNKFKSDPSSNPYGCKLLNGTDIPFDNAIGDGIGLFPINYLNEAIAHPEEGNNSSNWRIINRVVSDYLLKWPFHLPDGTISRTHGWKGEQDRNGSFLWGDDQFMGLALIARLAVYQRNASLAELAGKQAIQFAHHMMDTDDGLFFHGYNDADKKESCCKWGRANGWGMMAHIEVLTALKALRGKINPDLEKDLESVFASHVGGVIATQTTDGRWNQVLGVNSTYLETSATAMFLTSLARGVRGGWLAGSPDVYNAIKRGWSGLQKTLEKDGSISGICPGTGIQTDIAAYEKRDPVYIFSAPGLGSVLYAARDVNAFFTDDAKKTYDIL